jgi:hypothetical protein
MKTGHTVYLLNASFFPFSKTVKQRFNGAGVIRIKAIKSTTVVQESSSKSKNYHREETSALAAVKRQHQEKR